LALKYVTPFEIRIQSAAQDYAKPERSELGNAEPKQRPAPPNNVKSALK
jgi:hypothetical protein